MEELITTSDFPTLDEIGIPITAPIKDDSEELIAGLLPLKGQLVISGATNIGKSLLALETISSLVSGQPLWGELKPTRKIKKVLYCLGEHYNEVIMRLAQHTQLPFTDQVILVGPEQLAWDKWLVSGGRVNMQAFKKFTKWLEGVDLCVFDPLSAFISGVDAENDNIQMRLVLQTMNDLTHAAGASCIVLAHQGKPQMDQYGKEHSRKSYAIRGASAIEDAATNIFYMDAAVGGSDAAQKATDGRVYSLIQRKYKGTAPPEYRLLRDATTLSHTLLGNRPFAEVVKMDRAAKVARLQAAFPDMKFSDVLKVVAVTSGCSEMTIRRDLGAK